MAKIKRRILWEFVIYKKMDYRKLIRILSIVLIITALGVGAYYLWQWVNSKGGVMNAISGKTTQPTTEIIETQTTETTTTTTTQSEIDIATQGAQAVTPKLSILINSPVFEYWMNSEENSIYFANLNGQIIKINSDGSRRLVSSQNLQNLHEIKPSNDGSLAIAEFNYPSMPTLSIFSASSTSWQPLPSGAISAAFSPDSKKIMYTDQTSLKLLDLAAKKTTEIQKMSQVGLNINWLKDNEILLSDDPSVENNGRIYSFDIKNKIIKTLINGERGLGIKWSNNGNLGIKINTTERIAKTSLVGSTANFIADFTFKTIPEKCLIDSQKIYCGVPKNIRTGIVLPDDFYKKKEYFIDDIYVLDLQTSQFIRLFDGNEIAIDVIDLKLKDNALLFINRYDNKVYSLKLE